MKRALLLLPILLSVVLGCGAEDVPSDSPGGRSGSGSGGRRGGGPGAAFAAFGSDAEATAVPVEVAVASRREIADYLETNGTLEAENEVDVVARIAGPIVELNVEEGMEVRRGDVLARIDADEILAQLGVARVALEEARLALDRAKVSLEAEIVSQELFDQAQARYDSAAAQLRGTEILLGYTTISAPFDGIIVERNIKFAQYVTTNTKLFRISDFTPLLCPIQLPEKDLGKVRVGQRALLTVEAFPGERFPARVLRISPVLDAATGTVKVTLEARPGERLRPGMFASVYLEIDRHENAIVIPKRALVLESIGDTVYVMKDRVAERRDVELGFEEADTVEVRAGVEEGERVIVVGQDGLSNGTPVYVLSESRPSAAPPQQQWAGRPDPRASAAPEEPGPRREEPSPSVAAADPPAPPGPRPGAAGPGGDRRFDPETLTPERIERMKERMRQFGLSERQIEERIQQIEDGTFVPPGRPGGDRPPPGS